VDLEMALDEENTNYMEVIELIIDMLLDIIKRTEKTSSKQIEQI